MKQNTHLFPYAVTYNVLTDGGEVDTPINLGLTLNLHSIVFPSLSFIYVLTTFVAPPPGPGGPIVLNMGFMDGDNLGALVTNLDVADLIAGAIIPITPTDNFLLNTNQTRMGCSISNPTPAGAGVSAGKLLLVLNTHNVSAALTNG